MGSNPRRIYIYPPLQQDDGIAANRYWPPGISQLSGDQSPSTSSGYSESYPDEGGGLLGMLLRAMPQNRDQPGVNSSLASDGAPQVQFANYDGPQSGLFEQAAPQAEQSRYQPFDESDELPLSDPRNPDFRQLARIPVAGRSREANDTADQHEEQSSPSYFPPGGSNSLDLLRGSRHGNQVALPDRSFADRLQAYWNHPHPYGLVSTLKQALDGMVQAVQGSIDATTVPSTEEQAFRQNLGRERGPIGAWHAASVLNPQVPRGTGGIFASPLVDAVTSHLPSMRASERIGIQGIDGHTVAPPLGPASGNGNYLPGLRNSAATANEIATPQGFVRNPVQAPQVTGVFGVSGNEQELPWIPDAPGIQPGFDDIRAGRWRRKGPPHPRNVPLAEWFANKPAQTPFGAYGGGSGSGGGQKKRGGDYGKDRCSKRRMEEEQRCEDRKEEYTHEHFLPACMERAETRWDLCNRNHGRFPRWEPKEWGPADEDEFFNNGR
jgi:hypothetical protein